MSEGAAQSVMDDVNSAASPTVELINKVVTPIGKVLLGGISVGSRMEATRQNIKQAHWEIYESPSAIWIDEDRIQDILDDIETYVGS
jgi:hypothetical protein